MRTGSSILMQTQAQRLPAVQRETQELNLGPLAPEWGGALRQQPPHSHPQGGPTTCLPLPRGNRGDPDQQHFRNNYRDEKNNWTYSLRIKCTVQLQRPSSCFFPLTWEARHIPEVSLQAQPSLHREGGARCRGSSGNPPLLVSALPWVAEAGPIWSDLRCPAGSALDTLWVGGLQPRKPGGAWQGQARNPLPSSLALTTVHSLH